MRHEREKENLVKSHEQQKTALFTEIEKVNSIIISLSLPSIWSWNLFRCWNTASIIKMKLQWLDFLHHPSDQLKDAYWLWKDRPRIGLQSLPFWSSSVIYLFGVVFFFFFSNLRTVCLYLNAFIYFSFYTYMYLYHCIEIFVFTECASLVYHERSVNEHSFVFFLFFSALFCNDAMNIVSLSLFLLVPFLSYLSFQ